jgi:hypothetical protein
VKFLVDMPLSPTLARWLVDEGHDAVHASDIGMERTPDAEIIDCAKREGRTVITADLDYRRLLGHPFCPPFNQGISTLHSGLIDPSKNRQSTAPRLLNRRQQRGSLKDSREPPHLPKFNFQAM